MVEAIIPTRAVQERHRFSLVWLVPVVALVAAGWLGYRTLSQRGPMIAIMLQTASGLEAGKTQVRHNQIELGIVESLEPSADLSHVTIHVRMNRFAEGHLNAGTRFWVVRPRLSAGGISGLDTLISGAYVEMEPGTGVSTHEFTALEDPPVVRAGVPGTEYVLQGQRLGSVSQGAPVTFHGISVGEVLGYTLSDRDGSATVRIFVRAPHDQLVHEGTRFWNASGMSLQLGSDGLRLHTESLQSILAGGVSFDVPQGGEPGAVAEPMAPFSLYNNSDEARDALYTRKVAFLLHLPGSAQGLTVGNAVRMRGIRVGEVTDVHMEYDAATAKITVPVTIDVEPQRVRLVNAEASTAGFEERAYAAFRSFVDQGLRAQLESGNLLTGQKVISLNFVQDAPKLAMVDRGALPEIPVVGTNDLDSILQAAKGVLTTVQGTVGTLGQLFTSPEVKHSLSSLDRSLANLDRLTHTANLQAAPLLNGLRSVSTNADAMLRQASTTISVTGQALGEGRSGGNLATTLTELKQAAQSLHALSDYLEDHPGSLVWGKGGGSAR